MFLKVKLRGFFPVILASMSLITALGAHEGHRGHHDKGHYDSNHWHHDHYYSHPIHEHNQWYQHDHVYIYGGNAYPYYYNGYPYYFYDPRYYYYEDGAAPSVNVQLNLG